MAVFVDRFVTQVQLLGAARFSKQLVNMSDAVTTFGFMMGASLGSELTGQAIKAAAEMEKLDTQMKQIFGSTGAGAQARVWATEFANKTPFELSDVTEAFIALSARGIQPTARNMRLLGDLAASRGQTLERAALAAADAQQGFYRRLEDTFALTKEQIQAFSKELKGTRGQIKNTSETLEGLWRLIESDQKITGSMKNMEKSWETSVSNMKGKWWEFTAELGKIIIPDAKKGVGWFSQGTEAATRWLKEQRLNRILRGYQTAKEMAAFHRGERNDRNASNPLDATESRHRTAAYRWAQHSKKLGAEWVALHKELHGDPMNPPDIEGTPGGGGSDSATKQIIREIIGGGEIAKIGVKPSEFPGMGPASKKPPVTVKIETSEGSSFMQFMEEAINRALQKLTQHGAIEPA